MATPANWWQYSRWVYIVGRTLRFNYGSDGELVAVRTFLSSLAATRPWIIPIIQRKGQNGKTLATESAYNLAKMLQAAGRDLKKYPVTIPEKNLCDALILATGDRYLGFKGNLI